MKKIFFLLIASLTFLSSCVKINTLYENYEQLEEKVLILEGEISQLTSTLNTTTQALETATANYNNLQSSSDTQVSQLLSLIANLQNEKDNLEDELNIVKNSLEQLQTDVTGITGENNSLLETIASLTAQIEALEQALGSSTDTTSNTVSDIDFPDYKSQGHSMKAIGVWRLLSIQNVVVDESERFNILIYPDDVNPNKLNNTSINQTGWMDFNTTKKIGWSYRYKNESGVSTGEFTIDESKIDGLLNDWTSGNNIRYYEKTDEAAEYLYFSYQFDVRAYDQKIFPKLLYNCKFYRLK